MQGQTFLDVEDIEQSIQDTLMKLSQLRLKQRADLKLVSDGVVLFLMKHVKEGVYPWRVQKFAMEFAMENLLREERESGSSYAWNNREITLHFESWHGTGLDIGANLKRQMDGLEGSHKLSPFIQKP